MSIGGSGSAARCCSPWSITLRSGAGRVVKGRQHIPQFQHRWWRRNDKSTAAVQDDQYPADDHLQSKHRDRALGDQVCRFQPVVTARTDRRHRAVSNRALLHLLRPFEVHLSRRSGAGRSWSTRSAGSAWRMLVSGRGRRRQAHSQPPGCDWRARRLHLQSGVQARSVRSAAQHFRLVSASCAVGRRRRTTTSSRSPSGSQVSGSC